MTQTSQVAMGPPPGTLTETAERLCLRRQPGTSTASEDRTSAGQQPRTRGRLPTTSAKNGASDHLAQERRFRPPRPRTARFVLKLEAAPTGTSKKAPHKLTSSAAGVAF